ncbi:MAG: peptidoglycan D,D-transpeptidase FtsI family protein [Kiritimatiellia bacterium]
MSLSGHADNIRYSLPIIALGCGAVGLVVRLVYLHFNLIAAMPPPPKYGFSRYTQGQRGSILSSTGATFAKTKTVWEYRLDPSVAMKDPRNPRKPITPEKRMEKMRLVSDTLGVPLPKVMDAYARVGNRYQLLAVSDDQAAHDVIAAYMNHLNEIKIVEKQVRVYPQGNRLSHVLGFVSKDPTNAVGAAGIELRYERFLKGTPGAVHGTKDAIGREERSRRDLDIDASPGRDVYLTIDGNVQFETERALREGIARHKAERAWAIVMSVKTGAILAMASLPDYSPEEFNRSSEAVKVNRCISECYEPGSVMKTITACAVLNEGMYGPDSMINTARNDPNYYRLPGDAGHKWEEFMSVREALVHSSNIVFGKLGFDLGPHKLYDYMTQFGLGHKSGIELPGEETGIIPNWQKWDKVKWSRAPIGHGIAVTAIQMAAAYAAIGNDGELLRPYIVEKVVQADGEVIYQHQREVVGHPITAAVARKTLDMMTGVAKKGGTAKRAAVPGYTVAGKTGTGQMKEGRGYSMTNFNASFIGVVPATRPEIVILVTYQKPLYCRSRATAEATGVPLFNHQGGMCAAPTFSQIAWLVLRYLAIAPDLPDEVPDEEEEVP